MIEAQSSKSSNSTSANHGRSTVIVRLAILATCLLPFSVIPYIITRRHLLSLRRKLDEVGGAAAKSQREYNAVLRGGIRRERHFRALLEEKARDLRLESKREQKARIESESVLRNDLQQLLDERKRIWAQTITLHELGTSLADMAAFMQEIELEHGLPTKGKDQRGIERLRSLALKMKEFSKQPQGSEPATANNPSRI